MKDTLGILLAGGVGERLYPLTRDRAKPAVTFGGIYRIIDITLSNCVNSGLRRVYILTQYKALSLNRQIREGWNIFGREIGEFIEILPPMKRVSENWYMGTADAVYQNIYSIGSEQPKYVLILSGDHIYKMNYDLMLRQHKDSGADVTIATILIDPAETRLFGVVEIDRTGRVVGFQEKPEQTDLRSPYNPSMVSASMGVYLFNTDVLIPGLLKDAEDSASRHDFGHNILPRMVDEYKVYSFNFIDENRKEALYWRDVGTLEAYYEANMDLVSVAPVFNVYDKAWPIRTHMRQYPPAKFVFNDPGRTGEAHDSIVSMGCIISGGSVRDSVLSPDVRVNSYSEIDTSILFSHVNIGRDVDIPAVGLGVVTDDRSFGNDDVPVDDCLADAAMPADVHVRKQDASVNLRIGVHAHIGREHAVAHRAAGDDAAHGHNGVVRLSRTPGIVEHELGRRILSHVGANRPSLIVNVEHWRHRNQVHVGLVIGLQRPDIAPVERFLPVLVDEVERVNLVLAHHARQDVVAEVVTRARLLGVFQQPRDEHVGVEQVNAHRRRYHARVVG